MFGKYIALILLSQLVLFAKDNFEVHTSVQQILLDINKTTQNSIKALQNSIKQLNRTVSRESRELRKNIGDIQRIENNISILDKQMQQEIQNVKSLLEQRVTYTEELLKSLITTNNEFQGSIQEVFKNNAMYMSDTNNTFITFCIAILSVLLIMCILMIVIFYYMKKQVQTICNAQKLDRTKTPISTLQQAPKQDLINIAQMSEIILTLWTLKKHLSNQNLGTKLRPIQSNFNKLDSIFKELGFKIIDYECGIKYNEGMNVDVLDTIKSDTEFPIIKETIQPTIIFENKIIKKAKIIKEIKE